MTRITDTPAAADSTRPLNVASTVRAARTVGAANPVNSTSAPGKVYLIGAGPGAADLITVRGARLLGMADVVLHDALVEPAMLDYAPADAKLIAVGKRCGQRSTAQHFINKQLVDAAREHALVVRLKGGDPMLFGRADEEMRALEAAGIDYEIVPGITAALAGAAALRRPLTLRGVARSVALVTHSRAGEGVNENANARAGESANENTDKNADSASASDADTSTHANAPRAPASADTLVFYMGRAHAPAIARELLAAGRSGATPVALVEACSTPRERTLTLTLAQLAAGAAQAWFDATQPGLLMIGDVFAARAMPDGARASDVRDALAGRAAA